MEIKRFNSLSVIFELSTLKNVRIHIWIIFVAQGRAIMREKALTRD